MLATKELPGTSNKPTKLEEDFKVEPIDRHHTATAQPPGLFLFSKSLTRQPTTDRA